MSVTIRKLKREEKRKKIAIPILLIMFLATGISWQFVRDEIERKAEPVVDSYVDVGTFQAHYYSEGNGEIAFIFVPGSGTPCAYTDFYVLQKNLSALGQTVIFDHAGSGWSSKTEEKRTIENLVNELSVIIDTVAPDKPIILICHSLGSLETIGYAQSYPERVKGIIFLDSGSPEFYSTDSELAAKILNRGSAVIRVLGINRLLGELGIFLPMYGENIRYQNIQEEAKALDKLMYYRYTGNPATLDYIEFMNENAVSVLEGPSLGKIPILVLSSDSGEAWNDVQIQLSLWSEVSHQITIKNSKHYLYWSNYDEVSAHIEAFIKGLLN